MKVAGTATLLLGLSAAFVPPCPIRQGPLCSYQKSGLYAGPRRRAVSCVGRLRPAPVAALSSSDNSEGRRRDQGITRAASGKGFFGSKPPQLLGKLRPAMGEHDREIAAIAIPALLALLADPFLTIVDSAYVGRLGPTTLASLGPCVSLFHLCFNGFRAFAQSTTALVASALARKDHRRVRQVVTQAGVLAVGLGTLVATLLRGKGELALQLMGAPAGSELSRLGLPYLRIRALAAPCVLLLMVCEGTFRGAGDTLTPLPVTAAIALINLVLDPLLMFNFNMGMAGAAIATVAAQYTGAVLYLALLLFGGRRSPLTLTPDEQRERGQERRKSFAEIVMEALPVFGQILAANAAMIVRNGTLLATWALSTATATRMGMLQVASHQVVLSVWLFGALISESPGIAAQVLSARYQSMGRRDLLRSLARRLLEMGSVLGVSMGALLIGSRGFLPSWFTDHPLVLGHVSRLLVVAGLQMPLVALVLIMEGFLVGCGRFNWLAWSSSMSSAACAALLLAMHRMPRADVVTVWMAIKALFVFRGMGVTIALLVDRKRSPLFREITPHEPSEEEDGRAVADTSIYPVQ